MRRFETETNSSTTRLYAGFSKLKTVFLSFAAAYAGFHAGKSIIEAGMQMQALQNKMVAATGSTQIAAEAFAFARSEAERLGLDLQAAANGFAGFSASALRSGLTFKETKDIFTGVSEAAVSMRLSVEQTGLVFKALEQIAGKGTVSMEELRGQLGDALPGAFEIAAKAMGKSTSEFAKMVANGEVMASEFLPKFGAAVRRELGGSVDEASRSAQASFNRLGNSWFELKVKMADSGFLDAIADGADRINKSMNDPAMKAGLENFGRLLALIAETAIWLASTIGGLLQKLGEFEVKAVNLVKKAGVMAMPGTRSHPAAQGTKPVTIPVTPGRSNDDFTLGTRGGISAKQIDEMEKAAKKAEDLRKRLAEQVEAMRFSLSSETEQAAIQFSNQQKLLEEALEKKAITEQEFRELNLMNEIEYQDKLSEIRDEAREKEITNQEAFMEGFLGLEHRRRERTASEDAASFRDSISTAAQHNRAFFALEKAAALARAVIAARESVVSAYAFGSRLGGPILGAAFAGIAAAAQAANIASIASSSFGGGGSVSSAGGGGSSSSSSQPGETSGSGVSRRLNVTIVGSENSNFSKRQVRDLIDAISDAFRDGSRFDPIVVTQ